MIQSIYELNKIKYGVTVVADNIIKAVIVTGPTATGKTSLGCKLAMFFDGEIISADSRQVYKGLDIGTGKDLAEYSLQGGTIPYHLIDIVDPNSEYNLRHFNHDAYEQIALTSSRNKLPIVVGGTPLYIDSLISDYDFPLAAPDYELRKMIGSQSVEEMGEYIKRNFPEVYEQIDNKHSRPRLVRILENFLGHGGKDFSKEQGVFNIKYKWLILGAFFDRKEVHSRIERRLDERIDHGMIEEVANLNKSGVSWDRLDSFGLEYRYVSMYLQGRIKFDEMRNTLLARIRRFARSQDIWFRKIENKGHKIYWIPKADFYEAKEIVTAFLSNKDMPEPKIRLKDIYYGKKTQ